MNALTRRFWLNIGLLGLVSGLGLLIWLSMIREQQAMVPPLLDVSPAWIKRIAVMRPGQETLTFERRDEHWWMMTPDSGPANPILVNRVLQAVAMRCPLRYSVAELDLKSLNLDPPRLRLHINHHELRFGSTAPTSGLRYLQAGLLVHLCPDHLYPLLTSAAASFLAPPLESSRLRDPE